VTGDSDLIVTDFPTSSERSVTLSESAVTVSEGLMQQAWQ